MNSLSTKIGTLLQSKFNVANSVELSVIRYLEQGICLITAVRDAKSLKGQLAAFMLYFGGHFEQSVLVTAIQSFYEIFEVRNDGFGFGEDPQVFLNQADFDPEPKTKLVYGQIKDLFDNWRSFRNSPIAEKLMKYIQFLVSIGICGSNNSLTFSVKGVTLFHTYAKKECFVASDLIEYTLEVLSFFVEKGFECFEHGTLSPFLYGDSATLEYEKEYAFLMSALPLLETGNLSHLKTDEHDFDLRLNSHIALTRQMIAECSDKFLKNIISQKHLQLNKLQANFIMCQTRCELRPRPFSVLLYGKSGVGKSMLTSTTAAFLRKINDLPGGMEHVVTLNANDKYQSEFKTFHDTVILDDIANGTCDTTDGNPTTLLIDFINNIPKCALNAEADKKGKVQIKPTFVLGTTNVKGMDAEKYSNEPVAVARRFDYTVTVMVKPMYRMANSHMVDPSKIPVGETIHDIWMLKIERVIPIVSGSCTDGVADSIGYEVVQDDKTKPKKDRINYKNCSLQDYLNLIAKASREHAILQKRMCCNNTVVYNEELCPHDTFKCLCKVCKVPFPPPFVLGQGCKNVVSPVMENQALRDYMPDVSQVLVWYRQMSWYYSLLQLVPSWLFRNRLFESLIYLFVKDKIRLEPSYWFFAISTGLMSAASLIWMSVQIGRASCRERV
jgi:hypothetical protein